MPSGRKAQDLLECIEVGSMLGAYIRREILMIKDFKKKCEVNDNFIGDVFYRNVTIYAAYHTI